MKSCFWVGDGWAYVFNLTRQRKRQQIKALRLMGVLCYYDD